MAPRNLLPLLIAVLTPAATAADRLAPSAQPPAGLAPAQVPQFVLLGFDDNPHADPINWVVDYLADRRNPDGTPVRMIFFSNGRYWNDRATVAAHRRALAAGHELANHTQNHPHGGEFTLEQWQDEMTACARSFAAGGIPAGSVTGYRTPYLEHNPQAFAAWSALGGLYDSSIEEGYQPGQDGTNFFWPYQLEGGSPGLWEIPVHVFMIPADADCARAGIAPGLRARIGAGLKKAYGGDFGEPVDRITGLDWNVLEAGGCTGPEFLAILKHTLDLRLAGNRAPFMVGGHTELYSSNKPERRKALEDFIAYAQTKPEVRFVTGTQLVGWLRAPQALK
jgi:peptidoglycan/xylan/chitin deacetylase (PgdA/CDA1 family)